MTHCRLCSEASLQYLWKDYQGGHWFRCLVCGSDSSSHGYADTKHMYDADYVRGHAGNLSDEELLRELRPNLDWFLDWKAGKDFLDVGCNDGMAMRGMQHRGFRVHGFDVNPAAAQPDCTTIAPVFQAGLFPQKYQAVLCREVLEHVETPMQFLTELVNVTDRGGFLQVQTPRPTATENKIGYQGAHICLLSPFMLRYWLERLGCEVKDYRLWDLGQVWMCRRL